MRFTLAGLLVAALCVVAAPAAQASDESLKRTVKSQGEKLEKAAERYERAVDEIDTDAQARKAKRETQKLSRVVETFQSRVEDEQADSAKLKKARTKLIDALSTFNTGLDKLVEALDDESASKARSALRSLVSAQKKLNSAAKAFS
jgi:uncharacterized UPF0160 family protein